MIRHIALADCDAIAALEARLFATAFDQARLMALQANPVFCGFVDLVTDQDQPQSISADQGADDISVDAGMIANLAAHHLTRGVVSPLTPLYLADPRLGPKKKASA
jgi:hypothetical protein